MCTHVLYITDCLYLYALAKGLLSDSKYLHWLICVLPIMVLKVVSLNDIFFACACVTMRITQLFLFLTRAALLIDSIS